MQIITGLIPYSDISSPYLFMIHASDRAGFRDSIYMRAGHIRILFRYLFTSSSAFSTVRSQPRVQIITGLIPYSDISSPYLFTLHASDRAGFRDSIYASERSAAASRTSESGHINTPYLPRVWGVFVTIAQKHKGTYLPYTQCRYRL